MPFDARVFQILIASPGDVQAERDTITEVIHEWNYLNSREKGIVLLPLRWETHAAPELNERPQDVINRQVVDQCDMAVGVFWTRMGTPTDVAASGTAEEVQRVGEAGKPVMLYFSRQKVDPEDLDPAELARLAKFKLKTFPQGLIEKYATPLEFRDKFSRQLSIKVRELVAGDSREQSTHHAELQLRLAEGTSLLQEDALVEVEQIVCVDIEDIPDYLPTPPPISEPVSGVINVIGFGRPNPAYHREVVQTYLQRQAYRGFRLALVNSAVQGQQDLFLDLVVTSMTGDAQLVAAEPKPRRPTRTTGDFHVPGTIIHLGPGNIQLRQEGPGNWRMELEIPVVHATRTVFSKNEFWVKVAKPSTITLVCTTYSPNSEPFTMRTSLEVKVNYREMTWREIVAAYES
ncbi:DUF4062 domain-containing protein [Lentzea sp. NEAU-D13]|uniref:DUF4062 domain-containing protein n=1 Tax=Lentzea alba TaxID=2714351 RepID=A0A7C9RN40_9PSEU|nr:DUF4062 domain-containing protein [Lentzea alba]NGY58287.1 DUF4062 domain-containing protein [Lentzea alba]